MVTFWEKIMADSALAPMGGGGSGEGDLYGDL